LVNFELQTRNQENNVLQRLLRIQNGVTAWNKWGGGGEDFPANNLENQSFQMGCDHMTLDEDDFTFGRRRNVGAQHQSYGDWEAILDDNRKVEDDVHPDFMCKIFYFVHHSYFIGQKRKLTETRKVLSYLSLIWSVVDLVWVVVFFSLL